MNSCLSTAQDGKPRSQKDSRHRLLMNNLSTASRKARQPCGVKSLSSLEENHQQIQPIQRSH